MEPFLYIEAFCLWASFHLADLTVLFAFLAVELQLDLCTLHFLFFILLI